jgi:hypothetical protein
MIPIIIHQFEVDGKLYGITADGEIYSLVYTDYSYHIGWHITDSNGYSYIWNRVPKELKGL